MDNAFVLQAGEGNAEELERRIKRGQSVDVKHAVGAERRARDGAADRATHKCARRPRLHGTVVACVGDSRSSFVCVRCGCWLS